jgi:PAS domain S-box-containing protein
MRVKTETLQNPTGTKPRTRINILMVDDQPAKLLTYEAILEELDENLIKATSGREALDHLLKTDVAVVLMDVSMPEMDGFELADMIRQHPRFNQTAIIFVSAVHLTTFDRLRGYARGAVDYISVPFDPELLRAKVTVFSELYRRTRQLEQLNQQLEMRVHERTEEIERRAQLLEAVNSELMMRNKELDAIVKTAPDIIFSSRNGMDRDYLSDRFYEYTGSPVGSATGLGWTQYVHPEDTEGIDNRWRKSLRESKPYESEYRLRSQSGEYRWFRARAVPLRDSSDKIVKWYGTCSDIHDSKLLEKSMLENSAFLERTVKERTDALRRMSGRLMTLQDAERRRIARELHDSVGQELAAAKMNLDRVIVSQTDPSPITEEAKDSLKRAIQQVRTISHLLHPPLLDEIGLASAIRWYIDGMTARSGIRFSFVAAPPEFPRLAIALETALFRVVQEAMTNVYRHSDATEALVCLTRDEDSIILQVHDNGKGLRDEVRNLQSSALGVGIGGMKQRVEELGGEFRLSGGAPGTIVEVTIPLSDELHRGGSAPDPPAA